MNEAILEDLVIVLALGAGAQWLAWKIKAPSILALLAVGFLAGPVAGLLDPDELLGELMFPLVSLAAAVVLFEGGLTASWQELRGVLVPVRRLVTIGAAVTWWMIAGAAYYFLEFSVELSLLLGAILVVTGPTVVGPLLRHLRPRGQTSSILKLEGVLNDPIGAVIAVLVFQVIEAEQVSSAVAAVTFGVLKTVVASTLIGLVAAGAFVLARRRDALPSSLQNAVGLPLALVAYVLANHVQHESGLLAVTVMGIALASQRFVDVERTVEFTEHARMMLISALFIVLSARMSLQDFRELPSGALWFLLSLLFVIRPISVVLSTINTGLSWREKVLLGFMAPRGIVAAAMASVFAMRLEQSGHQDARVLVPLTFSVIALGVASYGLGGMPLVRVLGLRAEARTGVIMVGANLFARELGKALRAQGVPVVLIDDERRNVLQAWQDELSALHGHATAQHVINRLDLSKAGVFLGVSSDDQANTLAAAHFRRLFDDAEVYQLWTDDSRANGTHLRGTSFAAGVSYEHLVNRVARGGRVKVTKLTEEFGYADFLRTNRAGDVIPLLALREGEPPHVLGEDDEPSPGQSIVSLVDDKPPATPA